MVTFLVMALLPNVAINGWKVQRALRKLFLPIPALLHLKWQPCCLI